MSFAEHAIIWHVYPWALWVLPSGLKPPHLSHIGSPI